MSGVRCSSPTRAHTTITRTCRKKGLSEKGYYNRVISGNINQTVEIDSMKCDFDQYPYRVDTYARQLIVRESSLTVRSLVTTCRLLNATRSDNNPHGFIMEAFTITENKDLQTIKLSNVKRMKRKRNYIGMAQDWADERLRRMCGRITPGKRLAVILVMFLLFGGLSVYITVSSIYHIGKRDGQGTGKGCKSSISGNSRCTAATVSTH